MKSAKLLQNDSLEFTVISQLTLNSFTNLKEAIMNCKTARRSFCFIKSEMSLLLIKSRGCNGCADSKPMPKFN